MQLPYGTDPKVLLELIQQEEIRREQERLDAERAERQRRHAEIVAEQEEERLRKEEFDREIQRLSAVARLRQVRSLHLTRPDVTFAYRCLTGNDSAGCIPIPQYFTPTTSSTNYVHCYGNLYNFMDSIHNTLLKLIEIGSRDIHCTGIVRETSKQQQFHTNERYTCVITAKVPQNDSRWWKLEVEEESE